MSDLQSTPVHVVAETRDASAFATAREALQSGREEVAGKLRELRAQRDSLNRQIKALVEEDEQLLSALRPFDRAARRAEARITRRAEARKHSDG